MAAPASPREIFERLVHGVSTGTWHRLPDLYAEDCVVEHPFAPPGPTRRIEGKEAIRQHFANAARGPLELRARDIVIHETADPEVVIGEFTYDVRVGTTGNEFEVDAIFVLRVRDGLIVTSRDYANHLALARGAGRLPQLVEALND